MKRGDKSQSSVWGRLVEIQHLQGPPLCFDSPLFPSCFPWVLSSRSNTYPENMNPSEKSRVSRSLKCCGTDSVPKGVSTHEHTFSPVLITLSLQLMLSLPLALFRAHKVGLVVREHLHLDSGSRETPMKIPGKRALSPKPLPQW
jgi:hypothetical protein